MRSISFSSIAGIAYGTWISIEALLTPIIGGVGTVFGPLVGALVVKSLGEGAKLVTGDVPGLDLMIYGAVLDRWSFGLRRAALSARSPTRGHLARRFMAAATPAAEVARG